MIGKVLIACEYSGIVREAFTAQGWDATSCDLLPTEIPGKHFQGDVREILSQDWDMLIGFPPCQYLTYAGMRNWYDEGRKQLREEAATFFLTLWNTPIELIALENPRGYMNKKLRQPDQVIHPYFFGDRQMKRTCLFLKGLPKLLHTSTHTLFERKTAVEKPVPIAVQLCKKNGRMKNRYFCDGGTSDWKRRSKTFPGIAAAMATQWTEYYLHQKQKAA